MHMRPIKLLKGPTFFDNIGQLNIRSGPKKWEFGSIKIHKSAKNVDIFGHFKQKKWPLCIGSFETKTYLTR